MDPRVNPIISTHRGALFLVALMLFSVLPTMAPMVSAEGSITLNVSPNAIEINPGESGEYTVVVYNTGSDPVTVNLQAQNEPGEDCNGFTSTIGQIPGQIESGDSEETTMNITLAQTVEPESACDTTVTATITAVIGTPGAEVPEPSTETVTTTAGDGSGSTLFGVDLYFDNIEERNTQKKVLGSSSNIVNYYITVENTGQTNESIDLVLTEIDDSGCRNAQDLTVTLSEDNVALDVEETEQVTVEVEVPEGQQANDYCWEVAATVSGSNPAQNATDTVDFELEVPVLKECSMSLSKTILNLNPGSEGTLTATLSNEGNSDWTVSMSVTGDPGSSNNNWVSFSGPSSGLLPYNSGSGTKTFDLIVSPDDSKSAGSETMITVQAKDGSSAKCIKQFTVVLGQTYGATLSLQSSVLGPVEPGDNKTSSLTVTNAGNGEDTLRVTVSSPPSGWTISLEQSTVTVGTKHGSSKSASVDFTISVPEDALATESIDLTFSILPGGGGQAYQTKVLSVTVKETHGMEVSTNVVDQTGRSNAELLFPITVENTGNNDDTFRFYTKKNTENWQNWYEDNTGAQQTEFNIGARQTTVIILHVIVEQGTDNWEFTDIGVEITNIGDSNNADGDGDGLPDNKRLLNFQAVRSDFNYSMDMRLGDAGLDGVSIDNRAGTIVLPPEGEAIFDIWVENTGDADDKAIFEISGLEGIATRQLLMNGELVGMEDKFQILTGYGLWNFTNQAFELKENNLPQRSYSMQGIQAIQEDLQLFDDEIRLFKQHFQLRIEVNPGAVTGDSGIFTLVVTSESNTANRSGSSTISLEVQTLYDLQFNSDVELYYSLEYPNKKTILVDVINEGNVRTQFTILTPEGLRGWSVVIDNSNGSCSSNSDGLTCWLDVGQSMGLEVDVRPDYDAEVEDNFTFTLSVEPIETGVIDRQNIEFSVLGEPYAGAFGLGLQQEHIKAGMYLIIALIFLGVLYQGAKPTIRDMDQKARASRQSLFAEKLADARASGFKTSSALGFNPVSHRSPIKQLLIFTPLTLGLYPIFTIYNWGGELKRHANIGPGGIKSLLFFIIPFFNIYWIFKFAGMVRELEKKTMHHSRISGSAPLVWFILSLTVFPGLAFGCLLLAIPLTIFTPDFLLIPVLTVLYALVVYILYLPTYKIWSMVQNSFNISWTIWFGKSA